MSATPVVIVTGYLGSGKTTLIKRLLESPKLGDSVVIVNEFGEIGIDHAVIRQVDERTVLLASGCLCCTLRGDLADELRDLIDRRAAGSIPWFSRVIVETSGLADPAPIINTFLADPVVLNQYHLDHVIATVDAQHGLRGPESSAQVAAADLIALTKIDLVDAAPMAASLRELNPLAAVVPAAHGALDPSHVLQPPDRQRGMADTSSTNAARHGAGDVLAVSIVLDEPLDWLGFSVWMTMLLHARGTDLLRVKGLINVGEEGPLLINAVQHVVHPPTHLERWPSDDHRTKLVFIGREIDSSMLERSLRKFAEEREPQHSQ
jgi:G3E family GTPase